MFFRCPRCRRKVRERVGSFFENGKLPLTKYLCLLHYWSHSLPIKTTAALTQLPEKTVIQWHKVIFVHGLAKEWALGWMSGSNLGSTLNVNTPAKCISISQSTSIQVIWCHPLTNISPVLLQIFRRECRHWLRRNPRQIGGRIGRRRLVVEIDESLVAKRKNNR